MRAFYDTDFLIQEMEAFAARHQVGKTYSGQHALNNSHFYDRVVAGQRVKVGTALRILAWMKNFQGAPGCRRTAEKDVWHRVSLAIVKTPGPLATDCWIWQGRTDARGYAMFFHNNRRVAVHRTLYRDRYGPPPEGLVLDHRCANVACVNVEHLTPVTNRANIQLGFVRKGRGSVVSEKHCIHGHEMTEANTVYCSGKPRCRECHHRRCNAYYARKRMA